MDRFSFLNAVHTELIEQMYERYQKYPDGIEPSWRAFFQGYDFASESFNGQSLTDEGMGELPVHIQKEFKVINLIHGYRTRGHLFTKTNPVRERRKYTPNLDPSNFGLSEPDLEESFDAGEILGLGGSMTLREIIRHLQEMYCDSIGVEYMYIRHPEEVKWIQNWLNNNLNHPTLSEEEKKQILHKLNEAVAFESFLHTKFVGQKRFSLEGNESFIPAMDAIIERAANQGVEEFVVGMAHRGRLNVLANVFGKSYTQIFNEFEGKDFEDDLFAGDVKYHLGSTTVKKTKGGKEVKLNLAPNPSHLEAVDGVVEGIARAKINLDYDMHHHKVLPILVHGDAALAGQGVCYEVAQMSLLDGYKTGGTIHIAINNQIGFTTNYIDGRSSTYCTDVAKVTLCPVLHVNADDAEAVVHAMRFAVDYRMQFGKDVYIDLLGYRKYGHNEGDEPRFTQPKLYSIIAKHPNPREIYKQKLEKEGLVSEAVMLEMEKEYKALLEVDFEAAKKEETTPLDPFMPDEWEGFNIPSQEECKKPVNTRFNLEKLKFIGERLHTLPEDKKFIRKVHRLMDQRKKALENDQLDWGMAELLAYGSLLTEGYNVRISGEDVERGTFSHRHAVIKTETAEEEIIPHQNIQKDQGRFSIYNSFLSEYAVLGFDYGYAMAAPDTLTIWEAQFGDFSNGGQIIIDQYISAAEDKWKIQNGLVMLLPHGYEGQGAEHSSARMERYLQLGADCNMFMANCTTPANFYHLLRKQMHNPFRKPLVVFTPKSLLRHPKVVSRIQDLAEGGFQTVIDEQTLAPKNIQKLVFCSGKFYYDLLQKREEIKDEQTALVRLELLYPLPEKEIEAIIKKYPNAQLIWAQEEPENMGAWSHVLRHLFQLGFTQVVAPKASGAPAPGSHHRFDVIHNDVINRVFNINKKI